MNFTNVYNVSNRPSEMCFPGDKDFSYFTIASELFPELTLPDDIVKKTVIISLTAFSGFIASRWKRTALPALVASTIALACPDPNIQLAGAVAFTTVIFGGIFNNFEFSKTLAPATVYTPLQEKSLHPMVAKHLAARQERHRFPTTEYTYGIEENKPSAQSNPLVKSEETAQEGAHD